MSAASISNSQPSALEAVRMHQPKAFYVLFFVEMWERIGYYGMATLLVLYMTKALQFTDDLAYSTYGALVAMVYVTPILGGYLGDHIIGYRRSLLIGAAILALGYVMLATMSASHLYLSLGLIIVGSGYFKSMPSVLIGKMYGRNDPKLDGAYTLFYMSVNIGSLISIASAGFIAQHFGWHVAFGVCATGMITAILNYVIYRHLLEKYGSAADEKPVNLLTWMILLIGTLTLIGAASYLLTHLKITHIILAITGLYIIIFFTKLLITSPLIIRKQLLACLIFTFFAISFFILYFQAPMAINLFIDRNVNREIFGIMIPTASYWSLNGFWIIVLAPILTFTYSRITLYKGTDLSIAMKFGIGIIIMGLGFLVLNWCSIFADKTAHVSSWWIVLSYFLQSLAELLVSAIGVSMMLRLAPPRLMGLMMGTWYLGTAAAGILAGEAAKMASVPQGPLNPLNSLHIYGHAFFVYGTTSIMVGIIALCLVPTLNKLTGEKKV